jgi:hypothetical protein
VLCIAGSLRNWKEEKGCASIYTCFAVVLHEIGVNFVHC